MPKLAPTHTRAPARAREANTTEAIRPNLNEALNPSSFRTGVFVVSASIRRNPSHSGNRHRSLPPRAGLIGQPEQHQSVPDPRDELQVAGAIPRGAEGTLNERDGV